MVVHTTTDPAVHAGDRAQQGAHGCAGASNTTWKWFCIQRTIGQYLMGIVPNRTNTEATVHQTEPANGCTHGDRSCSSCWESRPTGRVWVRRCIKPHLEMVLHPTIDRAVPTGNRSKQDEHRGDGASNRTCKWLYIRRPILQFMLGIAPNRARMGAPVYQAPPANGSAYNDRSCSLCWESFPTGRTRRRRCIKPHL